MGGLSFYNSPMKKVYVSRLAGKSMVGFLASQGYEINTVTEYGIISEHTSDINDALGLVESEDGDLSPTRPIYVDPRIATHPDLYMCQLGLWDDAGLFFGDAEKLGPEYPNDIIYNAVCTRNYVLHLAEKTDPELKDAMVTWHRSLRRLPGEDAHREIKILGVRQGYTRCMCLPVDDNSFITSEDAIAKPLESQGASVLKISDGSIKLKGFKTGFIGGTAGNIYVSDPDNEEITDQRAIVFNGDLSVHPDFDAITEFIRSRNILPIWFEDYALEDVGSILAVE